MHRISGAPDHNSLRKTKEALDGLLSQNPENKDDGLEDLSGDEEGGAVEGGGTALEPDGQASGEATPANLVREAAIVDAKQMVNKEKARAELERKTQAKAAAAALKQLEMDKKAADKEDAKASGLRKGRGK